jgi:hypothetical protein
MVAHMVGGTEAIEEVLQAAKNIMLSHGCNDAIAESVFFDASGLVGVEIGDPQRTTNVDAICSSLKPKILEIFGASTQAARTKKANIILDRLFRNVSALDSSSSHDVLEQRRILDMFWPLIFLIRPRHHFNETNLTASFSNIQHFSRGAALAIIDAKTQ